MMAMMSLDSNPSLNFFFSFISFSSFFAGSTTQFERRHFAESAPVRLCDVTLCGADRLFAPLWSAVVEVCRDFCLRTQKEPPILGEML